MARHVTTVVFSIYFPFSAGINSSLNIVFVKNTVQNYQLAGEETAEGVQALKKRITFSLS